MAAATRVPAGGPDGDGVPLATHGRSRPDSPAGVAVSRLTRATTDGRVYLDLQNLARREGRATEELLVLYALEGFLARLAQSDQASRFVLKGGALLAAFGARRPTRHIDLASRDVPSDAERVLAERSEASVDNGVRNPRASSHTASTISFNASGATRRARTAEGMLTVPSSRQASAR